MSDHGEPKFARLRPERARLYPSISKETWWAVVEVEELGVMVDLGNRQRFLFWQDVETKPPD